MAKVPYVVVGISGIVFLKSIEILLDEFSFKNSFFPSTIQIHHQSRWLIVCILSIFYLSSILSPTCL